MDAHFLGLELRIGYLRSRRDDERARAACTTYLETWIGHFHPNRPDIVERAQLLAKSWGGELRMPRLSWKYDCIRRSFGWSAAKHVQLQDNGAKSRLLRACDRLMLKTKGDAIDVSTL